MNKILCTLILILCFAGVGNSATYYVDYVSGADSNNGTSTSTPFKHVPGDSSATGTSSSTTPAAGDTVCIKAGAVYGSGNVISIKSGGSSNSARIVYDGNCTGFGDGTKAKISGSTFLIDRYDYLTFQNLEMYGADGCIWSYSNESTTDLTGITITGNTFHDTTGGNCIDLWDFNDVIVSYNSFTDMNYDASKGGETYCADGDCCPDNSGRGTTYFNSYHSNNGLTFTHNTIHDFCNTPIFIFNTEEIEIGWNSITGWHGNDHSQCITIYDSNGVNISIHDNYYNAERHFLATQDLYETTVAYIYNNVIHSGVDYCMTFDGGADAGTVYILNNVCTGSTINYLLLDTKTGSNWDVVIKNNIVAGPDLFSAYVNDVYTYDHNAYTSGTHTGETGAVVDSLANIFLDTTFNSVDDFALKAGSPCINAGTSVSAYGITTDYDGNSRAVGLTDIGAYEYGSSVPTYPSIIGCTISGASLY